MNDEGNSNLIYNALVGIMAFFSLFNVIQAYKDKKELERLKNENTELRAEIERLCQTSNR